MAKQTDIITDDELLEALDDAAKPIDFDDLIAKGIIIPDGAWYRVPDMKKLPKHAARKVKTTQVGPKGLKVKFRPPRKDIVALHKKLKRS